MAMTSRAQYNNNLVFGIKAGASRSLISELSPIFVSEDYYSGYTFEEKETISPTALLFVNYRIDPSPIALEGQLSYYQQATDLIYNDIKDFTYTTRFQYHFLGLGGYIKTAIVKGFNVGVGLRLGINLSPENLTYTSNASEISWGDDAEIPSDSETQSELRNVIKGLNSTDFGIMGSYEFGNGLSIDISYYQGLNDMVETLVNRHDFINPENKVSTFQLTVGYAITMDKNKNDKRKR
jgi:hypothetical protein